MTFRRVPRDQWPYDDTSDRCEVWLSADYLVQIFSERDGAERMTVNRTKRKGGNWRAGITWDQLMYVKRGVGRGEQWAVEFFPADSHIVNVANMRHLWLLPNAPTFAWTRTSSDLADAGRPT